MEELFSGCFSINEVGVVLGCVLFCIGLYGKGGD